MVCPVTRSRGTPVRRSPAYFGQLVSEPIHDPLGSEQALRRVGVGHGDVPDLPGRRRSALP